MKQKLVVIIDNVGRYVVGKFFGETETTVSLQDPVLLQVSPDTQSGRLHVQTFPFFFKEFLAKGSDNIWAFPKSSSVVSSCELDEKLVTQYNNIANPPAAPVSDDVNAGKVIKLFADE